MLVQYVEDNIVGPQKLQFYLVDMKHVMVYCVLCSNGWWIKSCYYVAASKPEYANDYSLLGIKQVYCTCPSLITMQQ